MTDTPLEPVCADPHPITAEEAIAALQASERARMRERDAGALEVGQLKAQLDTLVQIQLHCIDALDGNDNIDWRNESDELLRKLGEHLEAMRDKVKLRRDRDDLRERLKELLTPPTPPSPP